MITQKRRRPESITETSQEEMTMIPTSTTTISRLAAGAVVATVMLLAGLVWSSAALAAAPTVVTGNATDVTETSAILNGTVNPEGVVVTDCHFEYGPTDAYGSTVPCDQTVGDGTDPVQVTADISGLPDKESQRFRLVATNADGTANATDNYTKCPCYAQLTESSASLSTSEAGAPVDFSNAVAVSTNPNSQFQSPDSQLSNVKVELPPGLTGNSKAFPTCPLAVFTAYNSFNSEPCPQETQVGVAPVDINIGSGYRTIYEPLYNLPAPKGSPARLGFIGLFYPVVVDFEVRSDGDYGITGTVRGINAARPVRRAGITTWGVPADPSHDAQRLDPREAGFAALFGVPMPPRASTLPPTAFLRNPTSCTGPQNVHFDVDTYQLPGEHFLADTSLPGVTDCDGVPFNPQPEVAPTSRRADSSSGMDFELGIPQDGLEDPNQIRQADLKKAVVTLPEGMSLNPSAADGLGSCSPEQIGLTSKSPVSFDADRAECPDSSKVGTARITTPILDDPLEGSLYVAEQDDNPFDSLLAGYMVAEGNGVIIKLAGNFERDPDTGQITAIFDNNPQQPFSDLELHFKGGPRGVLATPPTCGTYEIATVLTPWSGADPVSRTQHFTIDKGPDGGPCLTGDPSQPGDPADLADRPFDPKMSAGVINPAAGSFSPFIFRLTRDDGEQEILSTEVTPPEGVTGKLAGIPLCSNEDAEAGTCSEDSKVGEVIAGAGAGPTPFYIQGDDAGSVYLSGPYKGAPLSLQIQVPAVAGPFDLGMVNVRAAMHVDKRTAQLNVVSDPIPQILEGIPLRVKDLRIRMNREAFTIAPTNCNEMQVEGVAHGVNGAEADLQNRFQVGDCAHLGFSPKLNLQYKGKGSKKRNAHPRLAANLKIPGAESVADGDGATQTNIKRVRVVLPKGTFLDQDALSRVCTPTQWEAESCPEDSKIGNAKAWSPILDEPLKGPVYLKVGPNELPDLAADLNGIVPIDLFGKIDQSKGRIRNTFQVVPDVPVERFQMNIRGGDGGLLVNSRDICGGRKALRRANVAMSAHNGARLKDKQSVVRCGKRKRSRR